MSETVWGMKLHSNIHLTWCYSFTPIPYIYMDWCLIKHNNNVTFTLSHLFLKTILSKYWYNLAILNYQIISDKMVLKL